MQLHKLAYSSMCKQFPKLACSYMSLHAFPWACMQLHKLAYSSLSLHAVPFFVWAAHKNFAVLVINRKYSHWFKLSLKNKIKMSIESLLFRSCLFRPSNCTAPCWRRMPSRLLSRITKSREMQRPHNKHLSIVTTTIIHKIQLLAHNQISFSE